jgi:hypothetical protein
MGKIRIRIRDKILKFFDADLGWKKFGSEIPGRKCRIWDPDPGSATLFTEIVYHSGWAETSAKILAVLS